MQQQQASSQGSNNSSSELQTQQLQLLMQRQLLAQQHQQSAVGNLSEQQQRELLFLQQQQQQQAIIHAHHQHQVMSSLLVQQQQQQQQALQSMDWWTEEEHDKLVASLAAGSRDLHALAAAVGSRTPEQLNRHVQLYAAALQQRRTIARALSGPEVVQLSLAETYASLGLAQQWIHHHLQQKRTGTATTPQASLPSLVSSNSLKPSAPQPPDAPPPANLKPDDNGPTSGTADKKGGGEAEGSNPMSMDFLLGGGGGGGGGGKEGSGKEEGGEADAQRAHHMQQVQLQALLVQRLAQQHLAQQITQHSLMQALALQQQQQQQQNQQKQPPNQQKQHPNQQLSPHHAAASLLRPSRNKSSSPPHPPHPLASAEPATGPVESASEDGGERWGAVSPSVDLAVKVEVVEMEAYAERPKRAAEEAEEASQWEWCRRRIVGSGARGGATYTPWWRLFEDSIPLSRREALEDIRAIAKTAPPTGRSSGPANANLKNSLKAWLQVGNFVEAKWDGEWWQATIKRVKMERGSDKIDKVFIAYVGGTADDNEWVSVTSRRLRPPTAHFDNTERGA